MKTTLIIKKQHGIIWISLYNGPDLVLTASQVNENFEIGVWDGGQWNTIASFYLDGRSNDE